MLCLKYEVVCVFRCIGLTNQCVLVSDKPLTPKLTEKCCSARNRNRDYFLIGRPVWGSCSQMAPWLAATAPSTPVHMCCHYCSVSSWYCCSRVGLLEAQGLEHQIVRLFCCCKQRWSLGIDFHLSGPFFFLQQQRNKM